jgi:23S rRNA pseudouridine1911/1915/1917 synthase
MDAPPVEILYEEGPCLAVLKPSGLLTQAPADIDSMERRLRAFLKERDAKPGNIYLGIPHRLDRPVSGVLLFARHVRACRRLSDQFAGRLVRKKYWALVEGTVDPAAGRWDDWLRKVPGEARAEIASADHIEARSAALTYRTRGATPYGSWLEIEPETGRTHQIRVQAASRGYPVAGDALYGAKRSFGEQNDDPRRLAIALHARSIEFRHPMTQEVVCVEAPLPNAWAGLVVEGSPDPFTKDERRSPH